VGLIGGECSGKTSLALALIERFAGSHVPEVLREFVDTHGRAPKQSEQAQVMHEQEAAEALAIAQAAATTRAIVVCDPAAFMTAIYSIAYYDDDSLLAAAIAHLSAYDLLVWCDPAIPWEADGAQRDGPAERDRVDALLAEIVRTHSIVATRVTGSVDERVESVARSCVCRSLGLDEVSSCPFRMSTIRPDATKTSRDCAACSRCAP
jgi:nicotinamide riboside kinase